MKQKVIIGFAVLLLLSVVFLISRDLFNSSFKSDENPTEYNIDNLKKIDSALICYKEIMQFDPGMEQVYGISVSENNSIFISGNRQVAIFNSNGTKTKTFTTDSSAHCLITDNNSIYLGIGNHIEHYNLAGEKISSWKAYSENGFITSVAVNKEIVYVADAESKRILKYNTKGELLLEIGQKDTSKGIEGFIIPSPYFEVTFGAYNDLWVVNPGKHRIENYSLSGEHQSSWGVASMQLEGFAGCCNPAHLAVLPTGEFVTYEKGLDRIKIYDPTGKFICVVAGPGSFKGESDFHCTQATLVNDLATDLNGNIYVLDAYNLVRVYAKK